MQLDGLGDVNSGVPARTRSGRVGCFHLDKPPTLNTVLGEVGMESPLSLTGKRFLRKYTLYVLIKKFITETSHVKSLPARRKESIFSFENVYPLSGGLMVRH
jgi:hypothetical protein